MDWKDVAKAIVPLAPTLGGFLGGFIPFPGAAVAGQALGSIIARQFGVEPTPDAVAAAVAGSPNEVAIAKLNAAAEEAKAQWPAMAEIEKAIAHLGEVQITQVNETMRAELAVEGLFKSGWRPAAGWILDYLIFVIGSMTVYGLARAGIWNDPALLKTMTDAWPLVLAVLGVPAAVVGVAVFSRGQEKIKAMETGAVAPPARPAVPPAPPVKPVVAQPSVHRKPVYVGSAASDRID